MLKKAFTSPKKPILVFLVKIVKRNLYILPLNSIYKVNVIAKYTLKWGRAKTKTTPK
jgi:hypothetical protein